MLTAYENKNEEVASAANGSKIIFTIPVFPKEFNQFWENAPQLLGEILQIVSETVINQPYKLAPDLYFEKVIADKICKIYHPNHDTTHAIRQMVYGMRYLELVEVLGAPSWREVLKAFTQQEIACILLACFCLRLGRITEESSENHTLRSAQLFSILALQLGFMKDLVKCVSDAMHLSKPTLHDTQRYEGFTGSPPLQLKKARLVHYLIEIVHRVDLVRCWNSKGKAKYQLIRAPIVKILNALLGDDVLAEKAATDFMKFACRLCIETGNKVNVKEFNVEQPKDNKALKIQCTQFVNECLSNLLKLWPEILAQAPAAEVMSKSLTVQQQKSKQQGCKM